jgi:hypothetical protein
MSTFFTLAISAVTPGLCSTLADRARTADPSVMPIPGPPVVAWRSPDGRAALLRWGGAGDSGSGDSGAGDGATAASSAGTIWTGSPTPGSGRAPVLARTSVTRVDPVYVAEVRGAFIVADRATWAAWTASRLDSHDPLHLCALLNPGFPLGSGTPFTGVSALARSTTLHLLNGEIIRLPNPVSPPPAGASALRVRPSIELSVPAPVRADLLGHPAGRIVGNSVADPAGDGVRPGGAAFVNAGLAGLGLAPAEPDEDDDPREDAGDPQDAGVPGSTSAFGPAGGDPAGAGPGPAGTVGGGLTGGGSPRRRIRGSRNVVEALVAAVAPLRDAGSAVELSLTGGKDSRLVAAALVAAGVPVVARTHGFADHPDVVVAAEIARRLGIEHLVRTPAAPGQQVDVLGRIRATVLVADGMLSAFENVGRPDPAASLAITAGGHGGELLRGGYAETAGHRTTAGGLRGALDPARRAVRSAELLRRLTMKHLGLIRPGPAASYVASLAPWASALTRHPLQALDDFYLINRAGRWSAAARQAYLLRERLVQPLFDERVVLAARAVPLADRVSGALSAAVLAELSPALADIPLASKPPAPKPQPAAGAARGAAHASFDWRRQYGEAVASFLRGYILDQGTSGGLFDVVSRTATEKLLTPPHADRASVWALATLACLVSGDYRHARETTPQLPVT